MNRNLLNRSQWFDFTSSEEKLISLLAIYEEDPKAHGFSGVLGLLFSTYGP